MEVLCDGYKDCIFKDRCYHSSPHEHENRDCEKSDIYLNHGCLCSNKNLIVYSRSKKLNTLKNKNDEKFS